MHWPELLQSELQNKKIIPEIVTRVTFYNINEEQNKKFHQIFTSRISKAQRLTKHKNHIF